MTPGCNRLMDNLLPDVARGVLVHVKTMMCVSCAISNEYISVNDNAELFANCNEYESRKTATNYEADNTNYSLDVDFCSDHCLRADPRTGNYPRRPHYQYGHCHADDLAHGKHARPNYQ